MQRNFTGTQAQKVKVAIKADEVLQTIKSKTPAEIQDYIIANTTTNAEVRALLVKMALIMAAIIHELDL